jgi:hypothetical protein
MHTLLTSHIHTLETLKTPPAQSRSESSSNLDDVCRIPLSCASESSSSSALALAQPASANRGARESYTTHVTTHELYNNRGARESYTTHVIKAKAGGLMNLEPYSPACAIHFSPAGM